MDIFLLVFLTFFVCWGFFLGFIRLLGGFIGLIVGTWLAGMYYNLVAVWFITYVGMSENLARVIGFISLFLVISKVVSLAFNLLDKFFKFLSIIPFTKTLNRLAGAMLGALEALLILALIIFLLSRYSLSPQIDETLKQSFFAPLVVKFIFPLWPLLPEIIKKIKALI